LTAGFGVSIITSSGQPALKQFAIRAESLRVVGSLPVLGSLSSAKLGTWFLLAASTQLGPYEIVASLGADGMGQVYRARDTQTGPGVAVKLPPEAFANDPGRKARFERQARAVAAPSRALRHLVGVVVVTFRSFAVSRRLYGFSCSTVAANSFIWSLETTTAGRDLRISCPSAGSKRTR
jgi:serine/threonine protein kinase